MTGDWNAPEPDVMAALAADGGGHDAVLTVVGVDGSAYRRPGSKLLLRASDGDPLLADLVERVTDAGAFVERWNLTDGEGWGLGVRSSGVVEVLVEPFEGAYRYASGRYRNREATTVCTVVGSDRSDVTVGDRIHVADGATVDENGWSDELTDAVLTAVAGLRPGETDTATLKTPDGEVRVFLDHVTPPPRLLVVGAAPDVRPVVEFGERVGFEVVTRGVEGDDADVAAVREAAGSDTYAVVMTHDFELDRRVVAELLSTDAPYVGVLGPTKRFEAMTEALSEAGTGMTTAERARVFAPAGLDVGGDDPQTVALSIVAEVVAVSNGRGGGHLDDVGAGGRGDSQHSRH